MKTTPENEDAEDESLLTQLRALPRTVWILFLGLFIHRFGTFVIPFLTLYLHDSGYSASQIFAVFASIAIGGTVAVALGGRLSDLIGRKNTMGISLFGNAIAMMVMWQADSHLLYLLSGLLVGLTQGMYHPASNSLMIDVVPESRRVTAFAAVRWAVNLGFACGMAAGGFLAEKSYSYLFVGDALSTAVFGVIAVTLLPHGVKTEKHLSRWGVAIRDMLSNRAFLFFLCANLFVVATFFQWGSSVARLIEDLGYSKSVYGWLMAGNGVMIALCELPLSHSIRKLSQTLVISVGFLFCGIGAWWNGFAESWVGLAVAIFLFTIGEMAALPVSAAYVARLAPEKMRGRYSAAVGLTWNIGHAIAPGLGLLLYEAAPSMLWNGCLALGCVAALLLLRSPASESVTQTIPSARRT